MEGEGAQYESVLIATYQRMLFWLFISTLVLIVAIIVISIATEGEPAAGSEESLFGVFPVVILAGCLGAFVSALRRMYQFTDLPKALILPELRGIGSKYLILYSLTPGIVGAIAAAVLYCFFASGLITAGIVPTFACQDAKGCNGFHDLLLAYGPAAATDYAKVIVWGFVAGFAERLVPDALESLASSLDVGQVGGGTNYSSYGSSYGPVGPAGAGMNRTGEPPVG